MPFDRSIWSSQFQAETAAHFLGIAHMGTCAAPPRIAKPRVNLLHPEKFLCRHNRLCLQSSCTGPSWVSSKLRGHSFVTRFLSGQIRNHAQAERLAPIPSQPGSKPCPKIPYRARLVSADEAL